MTDAMARTGNTKFFGEGLDCIETAARYTGEKLGWDDARIKSEIAGYREFIARRRELIFLHSQQCLKIELFPRCGQTEIEIFGKAVVRDVTFLDGRAAFKSKEICEGCF